MATISVSVPKAVAEALGPLGKIPGASRSIFDTLLRDAVWQVGVDIEDIADKRDPMDLHRLRELARNLNSLIDGIDRFPDPDDLSLPYDVWKKQQSWMDEE